MSSYNSYDGVPVVSDHYMQEDILRGEWGYEVSLLLLKASMTFLS